MSIDYEHDPKIHTVEDPRAAFAELIPRPLPASILDIGCGTGSWLRAALDAGVKDVVGLDGIEIPPDLLVIPSDCFLVKDLTTPVDLGRRFDLVICLEVAEHLDRAYADTLIETIVRHSDCVLFSAPFRDKVASTTSIANRRASGNEDSMNWVLFAGMTSAGGFGAKRGLSPGTGRTCSLPGGITIALRSSQENTSESIGG